MDDTPPRYGPLPPFGIRKPPFATTPVLNLPTTFHLFPSLPPELQSLVWEHALSECYQTTVATVPIKFVGEDGRRAIRIETMVKEVVVKRRLRGLMLACRMANEVASSAKDR